MFGFGAGGMMQKYLQGKAASAANKRKEVTEKQFIKLLVADGNSEGEAIAQAKISKILGGEVLIGGFLISIKKPKKRVKAKKAAKKKTDK